MRRKARVYGDCTHTVQICVYICVRIRIDVMYISMYGCIKRGVFNVDEEEGTGLWRLLKHYGYGIPTRDVSIYVNMQTRVYMYIFINIYICICVCINICVSICFRYIILQSLTLRKRYFSPICEHTCEYANICIYVWIYIYIYIYVCALICVYMCFDM